MLDLWARWLVSLSLAAVADTARVDLTPELGFEPSGGRAPLSAWRGNPRGPEGTTFLDSVIVHSGRYAGRIERGEKSPSTFSSFAYELPVDFSGGTLELRGWLRYESVAGFAGLWLRVDGVSGSLAFDNMAQRALHGTADWSELSIRLPLDRRARGIALGALLVGTGRVWADDLRLFVDGNPLVEVPKAVHEPTVLERDTSFTASSGLTLEHPSRVQVDNLVLLGKVWGFLKYHHPAVVLGRHHWDFDLFRVAPRVLAATDAAGARGALSAWIDSLGAVPACSSCVKLPEGRALAPRLRWLDDRALLGDRLSAQLRAIYERRPDVEEQFYVGYFKYVGNPDFGNELDYPRQREPDPGYRLLALYRFWNMIEYWFPYRDQIDGDWDASLREFVPGMLAASTSDAYSRELMALIARVGDSHANLWSDMQVRPPVGAAALPVTVRFVEGRAVVTGYSNPRLGSATGLERGDAILAIDGTRVDSLLSRWRPLYAASNEAARLRDEARSLTRGIPGPMRLSVERAGRKLELRPVRVPLDSLDTSRDWAHDHQGRTFRRLSDDLAYLKLSSVKESEVLDYVAGMAGARGLVIDLRNYPSEFMVFSLGQHLVSDTTAFTRFTVGDLENPGSFAMGQPLSLHPVAPYIAGRVAILVDEVTQSQAEYTTMAFRSRPGAIVVGSQTAGADGNVSRIALPGRRNTMFSGIGVFYPDGRPTQRIGIVPDVVVRPTIAGVRAGRDEVLETAVHRLLGREITPAELAALNDRATGPAPDSTSARRGVAE